MYYTRLLFRLCYFLNNHCYPNCCGDCSWTAKSQLFLRKMRQSPQGLIILADPTQLFFSDPLIKVLLVQSGEGIFPTACRLLITIFMMKMQVNTPSWHLCLCYPFLVSFNVRQGQEGHAADTLTFKSKGKKRHAQV